MDRIFSLWFDREQTKKVNHHVSENFEYATYRNNETNREYLGAINKVTAEIMWAEPPRLVHTKCLMVSIANPFNIVRHLGVALFKSRSIREVARTAYYGVGIELAAISGIFYDSLKNRARIGMLERMMNKGKDAVFLAPCCQAKNNEKYTVVETGQSPEALRWKNSFKGFSPLGVQQKSKCCCIIK